MGTGDEEIIKGGMRGQVEGGLTSGRRIMGEYHQIG
jgi:hypothetical protein